MLLVYIYLYSLEFRYSIVLKKMKFRTLLKYKLGPKYHNIALPSSVSNGWFRNCSCASNSDTFSKTEDNKAVFKKPNVPIPSPDLTYLLNKVNYRTIVDNLIKRTEVAHESAAKVLQKLYDLKEEAVKAPSEENRRKLIEAASKFPNLTHPGAAELTKPRILHNVGKWTPVTPLNKVQSFEKLGNICGGLQIENTSPVASERSYYLFGQLAELEQALVR